MTQAYSGSVIGLKKAELAQQIAQQQQELKALEALERGSIPTTFIGAQADLAPAQSGQNPFSANPAGAYDAQHQSLSPNGVHMPQGSFWPPQSAPHGQHQHMMKRVKTCHTEPQHLMPNQHVDMARSKSSIPATSCPFTPRSGQGVVKPIITSQSQTSMMRYLHETEQQQPANSNILSHSMPQVMATQQHRSELSPVYESGGMESPHAWLQRMESLDVPSDSSMISQPQLAYRSFRSTDLASQHGFIPNMTPSAMTRSNTTSTTNQSVTGPLQMLRLDSASSASDIMPPPDVLSKKRPSPHNEEHLMAMSPACPPMPHANSFSTSMARSSSIDSRLSQTYLPQGSQPTMMARCASVQDGGMQTLMQRNDQSFDHSAMDMMSGLAGDQGEPMMRSLSSSSVQSTISQRDRAKDSLQRQIQAAGTQILAPKPKADPASADAGDEKSAQAGADGKVAVSKSTYKRPKRPKLICNACEDRPQFRGEHELRRHRESKHEKQKTKWVCVDPTSRGKTIEIAPIMPFNKCKACVRNKHYGQYYNAAAHLRRAHFKEKAPRASRSKDNGNEEPGEKRGGKGGGDWPPMNELKKWMESIVVEKSDVTDAVTLSGDEEPQDLDQDMMQDDFNASWDAPSAPFDDMLARGVGSNGDVQVENNNVYADSIKDFIPELNGFSYAAATMAPCSTAMPLVGSANFDFNSPMTAVGQSFQHEPQMAFDMFQEPHAVSMTPAMTSMASFGESPQMSHDSNHQSPVPMGRRSQQQDMMPTSIFPNACNWYPKVMLS